MKEVEKYYKKRTKKEIALIAIAVLSALIVMFALKTRKSYGQEISGKQEVGYGYKLIAVDTAIADTLAEVIIYQPAGSGTNLDYVVLKYLYPDKNRDMRLKYVRINGNVVGDGPYIGIGQQKLTLPEPIESGKWTLSYLLPGKNIKTEIIPLTSIAKK